VSLVELVSTAITRVVSVLDFILDSKFRLGCIRHSSFIFYNDISIIYGRLAVARFWFVTKIANLCCQISIESLLKSALKFVVTLVNIGPTIGPFYQQSI
jgi:hypothetical protein